MCADSFNRSDASGKTRSILGSNTKVINAEAFTEGQRRCATKYIDSSKSIGVLVGALSGTAAWDLRPLILHDGKLFLVRCSDPNLVQDQLRYGWLKEQLTRRLAWGPRSNLLGTDEDSGQIWYRRLYFHAVLIDGSYSALSLSERIRLIQTLISQLRTLHIKGLIHGHVSLDNMALEEGKLVLLDPAFHAASLAAEKSLFMAPETPATFPIAASADLYGLGVCAQRLLQAEATPEVKEILQRLTDLAPSKRPALDEVDAVLARALSQLASHSISSSPAGSSATVRGGRKISASTSVAPASHGTSSLPSKVYSGNEPIARELKRTVMIPRDVVAEARREVLGGSRSEEAASKLENIATGAPSHVAVDSTPPPVSATAPSAVPSTVPSAVPPLPPEPSSTKPASAEQSSAFSSILIAIAIVVAAAIVVRGVDLNSLLFGKRYDLPFESYWRSDQSNLMAQVAEAAVSGSEDARAVIIGGALRGEKSAAARYGILRFVLDPRWGDKVALADQDIALRLAVAPLYPEGLNELPPFEKLNPLIVVGIVSDLGIDKELGAPSRIPLHVLAQLPAPLGDAFTILAASGVQYLGDPAARAFAHVISGDFSEGILTAYFGSGDARTRLKLLLSVSGEVPKFDAALLTYLAHGQTLLADYVQWLTSEEIAQWENVPAASKLGLLLGLVPKGLSLEQYGDLTQFPDEQVRRVAAETLIGNFLGQESSSTVLFLSSPQNQLGRFQTVALLSSLKLDSDSFYAFLSKWFEANPDPSSVLGLLLSRNKSAGVDALNFQAASYLKKAKWNASLEQLTELSRHPEALARTLAYSRLDTSKESEREVLQRALEAEPNKSFRDELTRRLAE